MGDRIDDQDVMAALREVLDSATFARAHQSRSLLSFVTTETLAGRGDLLNERVVGRVALGRPPTYDTRTDAGARVQARRTRELLDRYYGEEGSDSPIRLSMPLGHYAVVARRAVPRPDEALRGDRPSSMPTTLGPLVTVLQLRFAPSTLARRVAIGLSESLVQTLAPFPGIQVVGPVLADTGRDAATAARHAADRAGADVVVYGSVRAADDTVRATVHLADARTGSVRWSSSFEHPASDFTGFGAEDAILRQLAAVIGDFGGVVLRERYVPRPGHGQPAVAEALWRYYAFMDQLDPDEALPVIAGLEAALELEPDNAHVMASLGFTYTVDVLMRGAAATESMAIAEGYGRRALRADPTNAVASNVLAVVELARGRSPSARRHAEDALTWAPGHPGNAYVAGMVIGASGDWDRGIGIIRECVRLNPYGPNHRHTLLAVDALRRGDVPEALAEASLLDFPAHLYGPLLRALCLDAMGLADQADAEMAEAVLLQPELLDDPATVLASAPTIPRPAADHLAERMAPLLARARAQPAVP